MAVNLMSLHRDKVSSNKKKDSGSRTAEFDVLYSTGFLAMDYQNGTIVHVESEDRSFTYNSVGIVDGSANTFIGRTGSGKSTLTTQIAANIIRPFVKKGLPTGLYIDDIEGSLPFVRKEFLLNFTTEEMNDYVEIRNTGINTENVLQRIRAVRDIKLSNRKDFEYDTGLFDVYGNRIFKLIPTVYMVDSLPMLLPKDLSEEEELGGSMSASSIAKSNTMFAKQITQWCKEANIIFITVNHILEDINMGFLPKQGQISGLKQGERLPGGRAAMYLANNLFRLDDSTTLKATEGFGIDGSVVKLTIVKSRTNTTKKSIPLIFDKTVGKFDENYSLIYLLKEEGKLSGSGCYLFFKDLPDEKFALKTFKSKLEESEEFRRVFVQECYNLLVTYLSDTRITRKDEDNMGDVIINMFNEMAFKDVNVA
jgi:RecA/RadA recombinase